MFKKISRIKPSTKKKRNKKKYNPWITYIFNHRCYVTFLTGFYSCQWKFRQWEKTEIGSCCCSRKEQFFYVCLVISVILSMLLLFVWIETSNEYFNFDWVVYLGTGYWFFWSIFVLSFLGILTAYSSLLLILGILLLWERIELYLHTVHKVLLMIVIVICTFLMVVLCNFWKDKWLIVGLSLKIFAPYVHLCSITVMVILSWPLSLYVAHLEVEALQVTVGLPFVLILIFLYLMPLGIFSPCIQEKEELGPKPHFFGHRGAPMAGPENTMMAFEKAVEQGAYGLETDVYLSVDRVPFLMHDYDLRRTTNIKEVYPEDAFKYPAFFKWSALSTLNAGKWFIKPERRPFYEMDPPSEADKKRASNQSIPKLADLLKLAKKEKKFLIFDLFGPPPKHPFRNTFVREVVRVILDSKIEQHLIFWLPHHDRNYVRYMAPGFQHVGRLWSLESLAEENISIINVDYKRLFYNGLREYKAANIYINLYIVNQPWLYSLAWCSRINSVTTDNIPLLSKLNHPYFFMTPKYYMFLWILMDILSAVFIVTIFCFQWWKQIRKEKLCEPPSTHTVTQNPRTPKEKAETRRVSLSPAKRHTRIKESPWTVAAFYPTSTKSIKKHTDTSHFPKNRPPSFKKTSRSPESAKRESVVPSKALGHTRTSLKSTSKVAFHTALPTSKVDEPRIPFVQAHYPETHSQRIIPSESSDTSFVTIYSLPSSFGMNSKKK